MSVCIQIENADGKRMCVYSERDFDYMVSKGWRAVQPVQPVEPAPVEAAPIESAPTKRRGRPARVNH